MHRRPIHRNIKIISRSAFVSIKTYCNQRGWSVLKSFPPLFWLVVVLKCQLALPFLLKHYLTTASQKNGRNLLRTEHSHRLCFNKNEKARGNNFYIFLNGTMLINHKRNYVV